MRIFLPFLLAVRSAASFSRFSISAGVKPGVLLCRGGVNYVITGTSVYESGTG